MEEAPENDKESLHSAHANGMNEEKKVTVQECEKEMIQNYAG